MSAAHEQADKADELTLVTVKVTGEVDRLASHNDDVVPYRDEKKEREREGRRGQVNKATDVKGQRYDVEPTAHCAYGSHRGAGLVTTATTSSRTPVFFRKT